MSATLPPRRPAATRPDTILVVDDDARVIELLEIAFGAYGWRVVRALDGEQAIRLAASERPDLVVLDVRLPRRSGLEVCEALRRDPESADVLVIMVSALSETEARVQGFARGADDYLGKPFSPKELVARIRRMLARSREAREARRLGIEAEIELARTREESQRQHLELRHTRQVREIAAALGRDLARRGDRDDLAAAFLLVLETHLRTGLAILLATAGDPARLEPIASRGRSGAPPGMPALARDGELARLVAGLGRVVRVAELGRFTEVAPELPPLVAAGITLLAPVAGDDGLEALLALDDRRDGCDLTRADTDLLHALLAELATQLAQQRRLVLQSGAIEHLLVTLADRADPCSVSARIEAAGWFEPLVRSRLSPASAATAVLTLVRLGPWAAGAAAGDALADAAIHDASGNHARLAALAERAASETDDDDAARLTRAGWAWATARAGGADPATALTRVQAAAGGDDDLVERLRRSAPGVQPGDRSAA